MADIETPNENPDIDNADEAVDGTEDAVISLPAGAIALVLSPEKEGLYVGVFDNTPGDSQLPGVVRALTWLLVNEQETIKEAFFKSIKESEPKEGELVSFPEPQGNA